MEEYNTEMLNTYLPYMQNLCTIFLTIALVMMSSYRFLLDTLQKLGDAIHIYAGQAPDIGVTKKRLTTYDIMVERELVSCIETIDPWAVIFAEEEHDADVLDAESLRVIDPISSTFNFIHGLPHYSLCVAHRYKGTTVFSAVYDPSTKELFSAELGGGAWLYEKRLAVSTYQKDLSILLSASIFSKKEYWLIDLVAPQGMIRSIWSLGIQYAYVAAWRADLALSLTKDVFPEVAGQLLVTEAWGLWTDLSGCSFTMKSNTVCASNTSLPTALIEGVYAWGKARSVWVFPEV